ncbi:hypothetical protein NDU88_006224 [Pleurodeles waltl]|uniref:Uncharacterized protein n=1 Tax=Pleurodeles waltl TaxID=8319 RepID=A0AAV7NSM5_PLEWA|nr:hypothetical protein NDU88_006224 [Pleurodeles waltl]
MPSTPTVARLDGQTVPENVSSKTQNLFTLPNPILSRTSEEKLVLALDLNQGNVKGTCSHRTNGKDCSRPTHAVFSLQVNCV